MRAPAWLYVLFGVSTVFWGLCVYYVLFVPKDFYEEPHVGSTVSYSTPYHSSAEIHYPPTRHTSMLSTVLAPVPRAVMKSVSTSVSSIPMYVRTVSSQRVQSISGGTSRASSTSSTNQTPSRGIIYSQLSVSMPSMQGLLASSTPASVVSDGGSTASSSLTRVARSSIAPKTSLPLPPGVCDQCQWVWDGEKWVCSVCGAEALDGCHHEEEHGYCWCPIGDGWQVWLFMAFLAGLYAAYKVRLRETEVPAV